ncbi:MAG TPA: NAD(P)/FAD-dependent oxidoreductase [Firmicutes bacterium]|jgi:thioredoxin reductase (NADPH)|nr:NAD(P)/FAD-dependent oxidoreductase [Bacillota bacterium]
MYDILIVGGGPAGYSAAINGRRRNKRVALVSKEPVSSRLRQAHRVDNYLGLAEISGAEMAEKFRQHAVREGVEIKEDEILNLWQEEEVFYGLGKNEQYKARSVILAIGIPQKATIEGEADFVGRGVSYCATCDGMFFRGQKVVFVSQLPEGEKEANFLADLCEKVFYLPQYKGDYDLDPRIEVISGKPKKIYGTERVTAFVTSEREYEVGGVFIERAGIPLDRLYPGLEMQGEAIKVTREMATNVPGIFAAGDCTGRPWQIAKAAGEGQVAALSAVDFLAGNK